MDESNPYSVGNFDYGDAGADPSNPGSGASSIGGGALAGAGTGAMVGGPYGAAAGLVIGAGLGLLKNNQAQKQYQGQMLQQEATTRYSPWTHMSMANPTMPNEIGDLMGGAASGVTLGQGLQGVPTGYLKQQGYGTGASNGS